MCILFLYVAKHSSAQLKNSFKLILATNRDEFYTRPSKPAGYWKLDSNILAGQDMQSGGTWLGMNVKTGKIAALLNIRGGTDLSKSKTSRGALITNFLRSAADLSGWTYCKNLSHDPSFDIREDFNQFNLLTIDILNSGKLNSSSTKDSSQQKTGIETDTGDQFRPAVTYFTNEPSAAKEPISLMHDSSTSSLGNSVLDKPFLKISEGEKIFQSIIAAKNYDAKSIEDRIELKSKLLNFLKSTHRFFPDPQLEAKSQGLSGAEIELGSSLYLHIPEVNYGTRTHTLILVDSENNVDFHEWTKEEPIDSTIEPQWKESEFEFKLNNTGRPRSSL